MAETRSSPDVLIQALEEFGKSEAKAVVVIFTDEANEIVIMSNASRSQWIGLCEYGKQSIIHRIFKD